METTQVKSHYFLCGVISSIVTCFLLFVTMFVFLKYYPDTAVYRIFSINNDEMRSVAGQSIGIYSVKLRELLDAIDARSKDFQNVVSSTLEESGAKNAFLIKENLKEFKAKSLDELHNYIKKSALDTQENIRDELDKQKKLVVNKNCYGSESQAKIAESKANECVKLGNIDLASLYFANAISMDPGNDRYIEAYSRMVIDWSNTNSHENLEFTLTALDVTANLLRNLASTVSVNAVEVINTQLVAIQKQKEHFQDNVASSQIKSLDQNLLTEQIKTIARQAESQDIEGLRESQTALVALSEEIVQDKTQSSREANNLNILLGDSVKNIQRNIDILSNCAELSEIIEKSKSESNDEYAIAILSNADLMFRRMLTFKYSAFEKNKKTIDALAKALEDASASAVNRKSKKFYDKIVKSFTKIEPNLTINRSTSCQKSIESLGAFLGEIQPFVQQISDESVVEDVKKIISKTSNSIQEWKTEQVSRYDRWAMNSVESMWNNNKDELGIGFANKEKVSMNITRYLEDIDVRYLSPPVSRAYSEVFQKFYDTLKDDEKIKISAKMALSRKKDIVEF